MVHHRFRTFLICLICLVICVVAPANADGPRVLPEGELPADSRLQPLKDLNGYFPFEVPESMRAWRRRAERVRRRVLVASGLWPLPTKTPLNATIHSPLDQGEYTVEKVFFESMPGFFVTGSLYRPKSADGKVPGVLCPHGHWSNGRFYDVGEAGVKQQISQGGERFAEGGRSPLQARCVQLARMGCVVFHYDMIGYADSQQISFDVAHRFAKQRPNMNQPRNWGLFSVQAESHLQSVMGLQTWNSIRALDFISQLPDVDSDRLAVTGASGGGTQTFMVSAIDPRVKVSVPAVMVSTAMQGGCTCENCSLLRINTGNVEFAGLFAPKPLLLTAADDWTKEMATKGFPELKRLYEMFDAADHVKLNALIQFKHNYNYPNRAAMYAWLNEHFQLGLNAPIVEDDYDRLTAEELTVWDDKHPQPPGGDEFETALLRWWTADVRRQLDAAVPKDKASLMAYKELVGGGIDMVIGRNLPSPTVVEFDQRDKTDSGDYLTITGMLKNTATDEQLPIAFLYPKQWEGKVAIWLDPAGKAGLFDEGGQPKPSIARLLNAGVSVVGVDLLYQGEFLADGEPVKRTRRVANPREAAAYTFGFNPSLFARRVHDVSTVVTYVRNHEYTPERVFFVGLNGAGPWAVAARAQARDAVDKAAIDTGGFRFIDVPEIHSPNFFPGAARYDDLPGMLAVAAPDPVWLAGEGGRLPAIVKAAYSAADGSKNATSYGGEKSQLADAAINWLLK